MLLNIKATLLYLKECIELANKADGLALNRVYLFLSKPRFRGQEFIDASVILFKIARLGLTKSKSEVNTFFKVMKSLGEPGLLEEIQLKKAIKLSKEAKPKTKPKQLVTKEGFRDACQVLLSKNKGRHVLALHILLCCGRRRRDLARITSDNIRMDDGKFLARLPFDKMNQEPITFYIDFSSIPLTWSLFSPTQLKEALEEVLSLSEKPFEFVRPSSFSREVGFRVHGLRSIKAVYMTLEGISDADIMSYIGWANLRSLERYRRLDRSVLVGIAELDGAIALSNSSGF